MSASLPGAPDDPWGRDDPPAVAEVDLEPLPPVFAQVVAAFEAGDQVVVAPGDPTSPPGLGDLPELTELVDAGWHALPTGWVGHETALLPAVWPREHRTWVPDRLPRFVAVSYGADETYLEPSHENPAHERWQLARSARAVGMPPPPHGRLWLLRSPWTDMSVASLLLLLRQVRDDEQLGWEPSGIMEAARRVLAGTEDEAWQRWRGREAEAARAWRGSGAPGRDVDRWVARGLRPDDVRVLTTAVDEGGAGLTVEEGCAWAEVIQGGDGPADVVRRIIGWRKAGLAADAPVGRLATVLWERRPDEVAGWLAAGFTAEDIAAWDAQDLPLALRWRDAGFGVREARRLVLADATLTPEEAEAFDVAGIEPSRRVRWVAAGFPAAEAREWTDVDVVASEARVWRSLGLGPTDARAQRAAGEGGHLPLGFESGWTAMGPDRDDMSFGVADPPGTRGSLAAQQSMQPWGMPGAAHPDYVEPAAETQIDL